VDDRVASAFVSPRFEDLSDPLEIPGMPAAVDRLEKAVSGNEHIGVFGDFDVDGLTGTAMLVLALRDLDTTVSSHIPHREREGHGLNVEAVHQFREQGVGLIVTVDNGSTAYDAVAGATACGIDTVITDHHVPGATPPPAVAVVNPHFGPTGRPWSELAGAGVAFGLLRALGERLGKPLPGHPLALAGLGTLADSVPLRGDNRILARAGLRQLTTTRHPGIRSLVSHSRPRRTKGPVDSETVAFQISPRLNAPGRLGDPSPALDLLLADDREQAETLAGRLDVINSERRRLSAEARHEAQEQLRVAGDRTGQVLVVRNDGMPSGLLGPLAGRLCAEHNQPAVAIAVRDGLARASARSVPQFDIYSALLPHAGLLTRFGGHTRAAGFAVVEEHIEHVLSSLEEQARWALAGVDSDSVVEADAEATLDQLNQALWDAVEGLEPFGEANPRPVFVTRGVIPMRVRTVGSGGQHLRLALEQNGHAFEAIGFDLGRTAIGPGALDIAYSLRTDFWNGRKRRQLVLAGIAPART